MNQWTHRLTSVVPRYRIRYHYLKLIFSQRGYSQWETQLVICVDFYSYEINMDLPRCWSKSNTGCDLSRLTAPAAAWLDILSTREAIPVPRYRISYHIKTFIHCDPRPLEVPGLKQVYFMRFWIRKKNWTFIFLGI